MVVVLSFKIRLNVTVQHHLLATIVNSVRSITLISSNFYIFFISLKIARKRSLTHDPCSNVTCLNGGVCHADEQGAHCTCPQSYFGERCELSMKKLSNIKCQN